MSMWNALNVKNLLDSEIITEKELLKVVKSRGKRGIIYTTKDTVLTNDILKYIILIGEFAKDTAMEQVV